MQLVEWNRTFETGLDEVDRQHRRLVEVTNDFGRTVADNRTETARLEQVFAELVDYTRYHFTEEEALMERTAVAREHTLRHMEEHEEFLQNVTLLHRQMSLTGAEASGRELFDFLMNWLVFHIMGSDQSMARQMNAITAGSDPRSAYRAESERVDPATGLLLNSLQKLFAQVSERNAQLLDLNLNLEAKVAERTRELSEANRKLTEIAATDALTGLANRRHALQLLTEFWNGAKEGSPLACLMIDADGFKAVNDNFGHAAGDQVLRELARQLQHAVRTDDIVCRLGGDEFMIICPQTDTAGVLQLARKVHAKVAALRVPAGEGIWQGSISVGVAAKDPAMENLEALLKAADTAVYAAKAAGRNCVRSALSAPS